MTFRALFDANILVLTTLTEMSEEGSFTWRDTRGKLTRVGVPKFANLVAQWRYDNTADRS
ncbi:hypothetical protein HMPREF9004_1010 [Schaalia cardiffensis F0333]|uniref:Uncharacterized protein n=1 Tax=Schaalia cardiffensis F0333 TaxID=888050 RepID=N6X3Y6_9ACTO|nr:hypothetical protein [Schaalia cardiffensis]ENO18441.1 hypothetical protein HMPREF9004_1010 [Schaalia cardiffensis F0333]